MGQRSIAHVHAEISLGCEQFERVLEGLEAVTKAKVNKGLSLELCIAICGKGTMCFILNFMSYKPPVLENQHNLFSSCFRNLD